MNAQNDNPVEEYARNIIRYKAHQLSRQPGFSPSDQKDIEQDLLMKVIEALPNYDAKKAALSTFIDRVAENKLKSIWRHRHAQKREPSREECSLNDLVPDPEGRVVARHETIADPKGSTAQDRDLAFELKQIRERMPEDLRDVLDAMIKGDAPAETCSALNMTPSKLKIAMDELNRFFTDHGLREYLK